MKAASKHYKDADQDLWLNKSKLIIQHISQELKNKYIYFPDLLQYLAIERRQLAELLKDEKANLFGSFCIETIVGSEAILNDIVNREEVIPIVESLLKQGEITEHGVNLTFKNPFKYLFPESDHRKKREKAIWASDTLHKNNFGLGNAYHTLLENYKYGYNDHLSKIFKNDDGHIGLMYRNYNKYNLVGDYFAAQALYDDLLNWNPKSDIDLFMASAAKFSYLMTHGFFVHRGMAAITEWIIRGIASHHGLQLGDFHEDTVGWPWRALITPNLEDYIRWFKENSYMIKPIKENTKLSTFFSPLKIEVNSTIQIPNTNELS